MAVVKMRKLHLVAMSYDKDAVLNALQRTNAVEVTFADAAEQTVALPLGGEETRAYLASVEAALATLCTAVEKREKENGEKSDLLKDGFDVSYSEFLGVGARREEADGLVSKINALTDEKNALKAELSKRAKERAEAELYAPLTLPFSDFSSTQHTRVRLGVLPTQNLDGLKAALAETELCELETLSVNGENALLCVLSHISVGEETNDALSAFGFVDCPYTGEQTGEEKYKELAEAEKQTVRAIGENENALYSLKDGIRLLKVYCDHLGFVLEKETTDEKLRATERTFLLQAYLPETAEEAVRAELRATTAAAYMEFSDPTEEEEPPTLLKNNAVVANFEGITNTYSAPNYREFDPNAVMAFFYSLFMGFIIGDMGYGLLMFFGGGYLWLKNRARPTGTSRLAGAFAIGGIFAVIWGALFNSLFGFAVFGAENTLMPDPQSDMWHLAGIAVPSVLIIAMLVGIVQLFAGYLCRAVQEWRRGRILDGIFDGVIWAIFSVGVALAVVGFVEEAKLSSLGLIGGVTAGVALLAAMLTAGRKEKALGKFTKGFGAAYGVINYASDILSYARLYGLMLSGAVIAQIIAEYGGGFVLSGNVLQIALGVLLLVVGNAFNLVMNLLGAYIHDARLQYVEFYGRFYEGEGELFKPLGGEHKYIYLLPAEKVAEGKNA